MSFNPQAFVKDENFDRLFHIHERNKKALKKIRPVEPVSNTINPVLMQCASCFRNQSAVSELALCALVIQAGEEHEFERLKEKLLFGKEPKPIEGTKPFCFFQSDLHTRIRQIETAKIRAKKQAEKPVLVRWAGAVTSQVKKLSRLLNN